jgi:electron transport complex protein RnfD
MGRNPFNPAMVGYAVLLVSFPAQMTEWLPPAGVAAPPGFDDTCRAIFSGSLPDYLRADLLSGASPLAALRGGLGASKTMEEIFAQPIFGGLAGRGWEWVSIALLAGGAALLMFRVIRWQIPVAMLTAVVVLATFMHLYDPGRYPGAVFHLLSGATMLGAFFIATDPVTAATSARGRLIYGAGIGVLTYVIRVWGQYHDGLAFAVLLMNMAVPLIDKFTVPRIYGERV